LRDRAIGQSLGDEVSHRAFRGGEAHQPGWRHALVDGRTGRRRLEPEQRTDHVVAVSDRLVSDGERGAVAEL
jgi:hypothetical protein